MITITSPVTFERGKSGRRRLSPKPQQKKAAPLPRIPRIAKLMALAIRFQQLIGSGGVSDRSELAELARVTQPRITQIMNLNHLAPDIQEDLLFLPPTEVDRDPIHEKMLRPVVAEIEWRRQREAWQQLNSALADANRRKC